MRNPAWRSPVPWRLLPLGAFLLVLAGMLALLGQAADHRDGPIFGPPGITITNSRRDINDVYVFRSPANANNTVLILDVSPFAGATTPATFDQNVTFEFRIANRDLINVTDDRTFQVNFGAPDSTGVQDVTLRGLPAAAFPGTGGILARGKTGTNLPVRGVGGAGAMFRAAIHDDPFFFDAVGFNQLLDGGAFPRPVGTATNFFGPSVNTLSIVLEVPSQVLRGPTSDLIGVWCRTQLNGVQLDRMGRPAINTALIPPVPRGPAHPIQTGTDHRNAFNAGHPKNDRGSFNADMTGILMNFYGRDQNTANTFASLLLPDILVYQLGNPNGFGTFVGPGGSFLGNGRRLSDDVIDTEVNLLTGGGVTTDNVGDDNGLKVTDGSVDPVSGQTRAIAFPYIGAANNPGTPLPGAQPPP
jgi:hypothetical protein